MKKKYIIYSLLVIILVVLVIFLYKNDTFSKKIICSTDLDIDAYSPTKVTYTGVFKKDKLVYTNLKETYSTKEIADTYYNSLKSGKLKVKRSGKSVITYKLKDAAVFNGEDLLGSSADEFMIKMQANGYECK